MAFESPCRSVWLPRMEFSGNPELSADADPSPLPPCASDIASDLSVVVARRAI